MIQLVNNQIIKKKLNLKNDVVFKAFFSRKGNEKFLIDFLEALLKIKIKEIQIREEVNLEQLAVYEKGGRLDLQAVLDSGVIVNIELQLRNEYNIEQRTTYYSSKVISRETERGADGIEERGVYRIHQFEKQEMIVVCEPEDSWEWYNKMWSYTVEFFTSMNIPIRTLECCSGDLADLKAKSCDVEAWSPRQKKYFEVGSCSNLTDAQARRLGIRIKGENGNYFAHTLNNTVVAPPRMLISIMENNYQPDGSVIIPEVLRPYMGGLEKIIPNVQKGRF